MAPQVWKWCGSKECGARNKPANEKCHQCSKQLSQWTSRAGSRVPGSPQDAAAKKESAWNNKLAAAKKEKDRKAKEQRDKDDAALKCLCCGGKGHQKADCRQADKVCNNCGKVGHLAHVCRAPVDGKPAAAKDGGKNLADDAFAVEAAKRGWLPPAAPAEGKFVAEAPPTLDTLVAKKKAVEATRKAFDAAATKVFNLRESLAKANAAMAVASEAAVLAERELEQVAAIVCLPLPRAAAPLAVARVTPAIDLQQFLLARDDPQKLQDLVVFIGDEFNLDNCGTDDRAMLEQQVGLMKSSFMTQIQNVFPSNFLQDLEACRKAVDESRAKKRKGPDGGAAQASLASTASPAAVNAAAEAARKAAEEAAALQEAADNAKRAEEIAQIDAAAARRAAEAEAKLLAHNQEVAKQQAVAKAEAEAKEAAAQKEARDKEAKTLAEKQAKDDEVMAKQTAVEEIKDAARLATLKRLVDKKRASSQPPAGGQGEGFGAKKLQVPPDTLPSPPGTLLSSPGAAPATVPPAELTARMVS